MADHDPRHSTVTCRNDLEKAVEKYAFLPFFHQNDFLSLEDMASPEIWFTEKEGPWEWKGELARERKCVYGKFAYGGAAFVATDIFPDLVRLRRDGYDFEGMWEDGLLSRTAGDIMRLVIQQGPSIAKHIRKAIGSPKDFDKELIHLQMLTLIIHDDFVYDLDRHGKPYGWGNAVIATPEHVYGEKYVYRADALSAPQALDRICERMGADTPQIRSMLLGKGKKMKKRS